MNRAELEREIVGRWPGEVQWCQEGAGGAAEVACPRSHLAELCGRLFLEGQLGFAGLIVEEGAREWVLRYVFYGEPETGWIHVVVKAPLEEPAFPTIVKFVHAADWHEREAEDLYGINFEGHPRLGDFVLHDDAWQEGVEPMRRSFSAQTPVAERRPKADWRPHRVLEASGAFVMPIGPVFSGLAESAHFLLETVGEDVIRALPRLFYKYRGIEKIAEGRSFDDVLLLAERFAATTAFAHALAFCRAVERICGTEVPERARFLRVFVAEIERLRHHVGKIAGICESTALVVAASQFAILEEDLLRTSAVFCGHRYLFGLAIPGGLSTDLSTDACREALHRCREVGARLDGLERMLRMSSSFLDRLEEVGFIEETDARAFGLVGPIARASGIARDLRRTAPYEAYERFTFDVPTEREGDGYARLRILFAEARQSIRLMGQALEALQTGPVVRSVERRPGAALGWVEAPKGGDFHWLRLDGDGRVMRYHIVSPSFINWLGFRLSVERFAFQDFPIILSTMDLSVAENDR